MPSYMYTQLYECTNLIKAINNPTSMCSLSSPSRHNSLSQHENRTLAMHRCTCAVLLLLLLTLHPTCNLLTSLHLHSFQPGQKKKVLTHSLFGLETYMSFEKISQENVSWEAWAFPLDMSLFFFLAQIFPRLRQIFVSTATAEHILRRGPITASLKLLGLHLANSTVDILEKHCS